MVTQRMTKIRITRAAEMTRMLLSGTVDERCDSKEKKEEGMFMKSSKFAEMREIGKLCRY